MEGPIAHTVRELPALARSGTSAAEGVPIIPDAALPGADQILALGLVSAALASFHSHCCGRRWAPCMYCCCCCC